MALILGGIAGLTINSKLDYNNPINVEYTLTTSTNNNGTKYDIYTFTPNVNGLCVIKVICNAVISWYGVRVLKYIDKENLITTTTNIGLWLYSNVSTIAHTKCISFPVQDDITYQFQISNNSYTFHYMNAIPLIQMR